MQAWSQASEQTYCSYHSERKLQHILVNGYLTCQDSGKQNVLYRKVPELKLMPAVGW